MKNGGHVNGKKSWTIAAENVGGSSSVFLDESA
jgi:hypothetical protein